MGNASGTDGPASSALCFYCFEVLASNFDRSTPPTLAKTVQLWDAYEAGRRSGVHGDAATPASLLSAPAAVSRTQGASPASSGSGSGSGSATDASINSSSSSLTSAPTAASGSSASLAASYPVYVTWNTLSPRGKSLRGCIGTFEPLPLEEGLKTYTLVSALEDYRFQPIPQSLIPSLGCELTLLADFEPCGDAMDWVIGTHGLRIGFVWKGRRFSATYLPHVCPEQGWTKEECLESLMQKAGWEPERRAGGGGVRKWIGAGGGKGSEEVDGAERKKPWDTVQEMKVVRYTGFHAEASYREWQEWRAWASDKF